MGFFTPTAHRDEYRQALQQWLAASTEVEARPCRVIISSLCGTSQYYQNGLKGYVEELLNKQRNGRPKGK